MASCTLWVSASHFIIFIYIYIYTKCCASEIFQDQTNNWICMNVTTTIQEEAQPKLAT